MAPAENEDEEVVAAEVEAEGEEADDHGKPAAVDGVEGGLEDFECGVEDEAVSVGAEGGGGLEAVADVEVSTLVEEADDGFCEEGEADGGGEDEEGDLAESFGKGGVEIGGDAVDGGAGEGGEGDGGDGDAEDADGELHEAEGIVEPADGTALDGVGEHGVDDDVDLHDRCGDHGGGHEFQDLADAGIAPAEVGDVAVSGAAEGGELADQLRGTADDDADGEADEALRAPGGVHPVAEGRAAGHGADVEKARRKRGHAEDVLGVEQAHHECGERD